MDSQGNIRNPELLNRRVSFRGMKYLIHGRPAIPLCDFDAVFDLCGRGLILYECKYAGTKQGFNIFPNDGERIALENTARAASAGGMPCLVMVCGHAAEEEPNLSKSLVLATYSGTTGQWKRYQRDWKHAYTAREFTNKFIKRHAPGLIEPIDD